jgi:hypothetical protein
MTTSDLAADEDLDHCPSGACDDVQECTSCDGYDGEFDDYCYRCGGSGSYVPDHCCICGGSPYCVCCRTCNNANVGLCRCPITTEIDGKQVTL